MGKFKILLKFLLIPIMLLLSQFVQASPSNTSSEIQSYKNELKYLPDFQDIYIPNCSPHETVKVTVNLTVDTQGNVIETALAKSSGDNKVDNSAMRLANDIKFYPFQKNGSPAIAHVPLTISIICPPLSYLSDIEIKRRKAIHLQELSKSIDKQ